MATEGFLEQQGPNHIVRIRQDQNLDELFKVAIEGELPVARRPARSFCAGTRCYLSVKSVRVSPIKYFLRRPVPMECSHRLISNIVL